MAPAKRSTGKPRRKRRSPSATGMMFGKEVAALRSEFKETRAMLRRYGNVALTLAFSSLGHSTGVHAFGQLGDLLHEFGTVLLHGLG